MDAKDIDQKAQDALRRGWYLGEKTFRDRLLDLVDKAKGVKARKRSKSECVRNDHGEKDAARLILECAPELGLPTGAAELARLRKGDTLGELGIDQPCRTRDLWRREDAGTITDKLAVRVGPRGCAVLRLAAAKPTEP